MSWRQDRRSVKHHGLPWQGWRNKSRLGILDLYDKAHTEAQQAAIVILFETGCRVTEALALKPEMFRINEESIVGYNVPVEKYYSYVKEDGEKVLNDNPELNRKFKTLSKDVVRQVFIRRKGNPLSEMFAYLIENCETEYLLPARSKTYSRVLPGDMMTRQYLYKLIRGLDNRVWPHWVRSQTISYLIEEVGLDPYAIKLWASWSSLEMSSEYFKRGGVELGRLMKVTKWAV